MEAITSSLQEQLRLLAEIEKQRAALTVSAATPDMRVTATVDASGQLIGLELSDDIGKLTPAEIAEAVLATTRQAAAEVTKLSGELFEPMNESRNRMPTLSELFESYPEIESQLSAAAEEVTAERIAGEEMQEMSIPRTESLVSARPDEEDILMEFDEVVDISRAEETGSGSTVADRGWE
ncbi:YbaB/EbfC family nucleoid-associated protein [Nocardia carnea]|uniref:YbaB/EbfC family nucleoid-associated protein n=1 Tax=Nocardia carnea TaxID=37328 RepID=UPI0024576615|nr:YbaB/EbfC family nucleoid-associated protein [Nocardia carnea]